MPFTAIIGIDPSLSSTGLARIEDGRCVTATRSSKAPPTALKDDWNLRDDRLGALVESVISWVLVDGATPAETLVVMETPAYSRLVGHSHDRSGLWWRLFSKLRREGCAMLPLTPQHRMKYATGKGAAQKDLVLAAAIRRYPEVDITGNDVADAVLLADIAARLNGRPLCDGVPKSCWPLAKMPAFPTAPDRNPFARRG